MFAEYITAVPVTYSPGNSAREKNVRSYQFHRTEPLLCPAEDTWVQNAERCVTMVTIWARHGEGTSGNAWYAEVNLVGILQRRLYVEKTLRVNRTHVSITVRATFSTELLYAHAQEPVTLGSDARLESSTCPNFPTCSLAGCLITSHYTHGRTLDWSLFQ